MDPLDVTWLPFELHADTPNEGIPLSEYFGSSPERVASMQDGLRRRAEDLGLAFRTPEILSNTRRAHILSEYARDEGKLDGLHRVLFQMNFVEGRNLGDDDVLREAARTAGLDPDAAMAALGEPRYLERVESSFQRAREIGITGVPAFIVEGKYKIVGAHPLEALRDAFQRIAQAEV